MHHRFGPLDQPRQSLAIGEIAHHPVHTQRPMLGHPPRQRPHRKALPRRHFDKRAPDKAGAPGHGNQRQIHASSTIWSRCTTAERGA